MVKEEVYFEKNGKVRFLKKKYVQVCSTYLDVVVRVLGNLSV